MYSSNKCYLLLIYCCVYIVCAHVPPRLPMEVFGVNSTHVVTNSSVEERKIVQRHKLLLNSYATVAAPSTIDVTSTLQSSLQIVVDSADQQRRGRQIEDMHNSARVLYQVGVNKINKFQNFLNFYSSN